MYGLPCWITGQQVVFFFFGSDDFFEDKFKHKNVQHLDMFLHKLKDIYINVKWTLSHSKTLWLCLQNHYGNMKEAQLLAFHVKVWDGHMRILGKAYPLRIQQGNHGETGQLWSFRYNNPLRLRTCSAQKITSSKRFCIFHIYHQMYMFGNFSWNSRETQGPTSGSTRVFSPRDVEVILKSQGFWRLVTQHGVLPGMAVMALEVAVAMFLWMKKKLIQRGQPEKMWGCKQLTATQCLRRLDRLGKIWPANLRLGTGFLIWSKFSLLSCREKARWGPNVEKANQLHKNTAAEKAAKNRMNERLRSCKVLQADWSLRQCDWDAKHFLQFSQHSALLLRILEIFRWCCQERGCLGPGPFSFSNLVGHPPETETFAFLGWTNPVPKCQGDQHLFKHLLKGFAAFPKKQRLNGKPPYHQGWKGVWTTTVSDIGF